jgi:hypothetical protein
MKVPTDTTVTLLHNMVEVTDFSNAFGHALFVDDPEKFNRVVDDFVQTLPR